MRPESEFAANHPARDKLLYTPGPLTTSSGVRQAMSRDLGARDVDFLRIVSEIRAELLRVAALSPDEYAVVLMQGSGTFGCESVLGSVVPRGGKLLTIANGAYGKRLGTIARTLDIETVTLAYPEDAVAEPSNVERALADDPAIDAVAVVHCETTTGLLNPVEEIARIVRKRGRICVVDAMSSFGGIPIDVAGSGIDFLISSSNKCVEGVPGFSFILARKEPLIASEGRARSHSLDLFDQWREMEERDHFRFTPPTHAMLAFRQALAELDEEGGVEARARRYAANHAALVEGTRALGLEPYLRPEIQSHIITAYLYPDHPGFHPDEFHARLRVRGHVIYPGKLSERPTFRVGNIGRLFPDDLRGLVHAMRDALIEMGVPVPAPRPAPR